MDANAIIAEYEFNQIFVFAVCRYFDLPVSNSGKCMFRELVINSFIINPHGIARSMPRETFSISRNSSILLQSDENGINYLPNPDVII